MAIIRSQATEGSLSFASMGLAGNSSVTKELNGELPNLLQDIVAMLLNNIIECINFDVNLKYGASTSLTMRYNCVESFDLYGQ